MKHSLFASILVPAVLSGVLSAQDPAAQAMGPHRDQVYPTRIEVKLAEDSGAVLEEGGLRSRSGRDLRPVAGILEGAVRVERMIPLPLATLDRWFAATRGGAAPHPNHLGLWFRVVAKDAGHGRALLAALKAQPAVQEAYLEPVPLLPGGSDLAPPTPQYSVQQGYAGAPPNGVNSDPAHTLVGGRGRGVRITDMEVFWTGEHEDLTAMDAKDVFLGARYVSSSGAHGTAVAGEMVGDRNGYGVRGISDMAKLHVSSWNDGGVAAAIARGVQVGQPGDIVLLEVHYSTSQGYVPAEAYTSNYDVILTGTKLGIHICEAAGNGSVNLDQLSINGQPTGFLDPSSKNFRDSGAIMVGATNGAATARAGFSNHGRRITANGWGYNVATTGYGDLFNGGGDIKQYYSARFSGTSSASPIVTACVANLVGAVKYQDDKVLTVSEVQDLLLKHGTKCTGAIANRPDLKAMLKAVGLPDGLEQSQESFDLGEDFVIELTGPAGSATALFLGENLNRVDLGMNRKFHLDIPTMVHLGNFKMPYQFKVKVPNIPALKGKDFFTQGIRADAKGALHVTNSNQAWVR